jgi:hypothetical protein
VLMLLEGLGALLVLKFGFESLKFDKIRRR